MKIAELKERLDNCIDLYIDLFCQKQDAYAMGWVGGIKGGLIEIADAYLSLEDIRLDLEKDAPKGAIWDWYWDNMESENSINYYSYLTGLRIKDIENQK